MFVSCSVPSLCKLSWLCVDSSVCHAQVDPALWRPRRKCQSCAMHHAYLCLSGGELTKSQAGSSTVQLHEAASAAHAAPPACLPQLPQSQPLTQMAFLAECTLLLLQLPASLID